MLISYPIIPGDGTTPMTLDAFLQQYVKQGGLTPGCYPVSFKDRWHGGIHLDPGDEPIRAIADGEVVCYRIAKSPETYPGLGDYDTSFVLLKHTTDTGENTTGIVFYSLYMHLASRKDLNATNHTPAWMPQMPQWLQDDAATGTTQPGGGRKVWRKDILGFGGQLYADRHVHFEIFMTDISTVWKDSKALAQGATGSPDFFGDAGFVIPAGTAVSDKHPHAEAHRATRRNHSDPQLYIADQVEPLGEAGESGGQASAVTPVPIDNALAGAGTQTVSTDGRLFVTLSYDKGNRIATSFMINAQGDVESLGDPLKQAEYEYNLYPIAKALYPDCPSAGYEWLRFGRVLSSDTTTHIENWQYVRYGKDPEAVGYVNLAATNITKLSDADFPFWQGWQTIDDDKTVVKEDGICDVPALQKLLNIPVDQQGQSLLDPPDFATRVKDPATAAKLRHLICKFNSEWDVSDLETRYKRWRDPGQPLATPDAWKNFKDHVTKLAFWPGTGGLARSVWHFHPLQFIAHYRKCAWRSLNEMAQLMPRNPGSGYPSVTWNGATDPQAGFGKYHLNLNKAWRKYGITTPERQAAFISQVYTETGLLALMKEGGSGHSKIYAAFYGRGMMQLTWASNFEEYGKFRNFPNHSGGYVDSRITATSTHEWSPPIKDKQGAIHHIMKVWAPRYDPDIVASDDFNACDSAGFYWIGKHFMGHSDIDREADGGLSTDHIGQISVLVNGGGNGYEERMRRTPYAYRVLSDSTDIKLSEKLSYNKQSISHGAWVSGSSGSETIDFTPQRP